MKPFAEARKIARILAGPPRRRDEGILFGLRGPPGAARPTKRYGKTAILSVSIPADMRARLAEAALAENRTLSNFVRVLLDGATEAIVASRRGYIDVGLVDVTGFAGEEAIEVDTGGFVLLRGSGGVFPAQGSSPDFLSVAVKYGGKVVLTDGAPSFGRASGNDYDVGNGSPKNKSDFSVAGAHISHSDGSVIVRDS